jgi:3D (Asp-Asp-Asp) domain-containing protein
MRNCSQLVSAILLVIAPSIGTIAIAKEDIKNKAVEIQVETKEIPTTVEYQFSRLVGPGRVQKTQDGKPGEVRRTYQISHKDGKAVDKTLIKEERIEPTPTLFLMGKSGFPTSRSAFGRSKVLVMSATAYDPSPATIGPGATGRTRMGLIATYGHVAVDPRVIPLGSLVFVEGYGFAIASDTGGAIKGNRIDLCYDSRSTALAFGRKKVKVHVLRKSA